MEIINDQRGGQQDQQGGMGGQQDRGRNEETNE